MSRSVSSHLALAHNSTEIIAVFLQRFPSRYFCKLEGLGFFISSLVGPSNLVLQETKVLTYYNFAL